jgi:hypothetical protein
MLQCFNPVTNAVVQNEEDHEATKVLHCPAIAVETSLVSDVINHSGTEPGNEVVVRNIPRKNFKVNDGGVIWRRPGAIWWCGCSHSHYFPLPFTGALFRFY